MLSNSLVLKSQKPFNLFFVRRRLSSQFNSSRFISLTIDRSLLTTHTTSYSKTNMLFFKANPVRLTTLVRHYNWTAVRSRAHIYYYSTHSTGIYLLFLFYFIFLLRNFNQGHYMSTIRNIYKIIRNT